MSDWPRPPRQVSRRVLFATWGWFGRLCCALLAASLLWLLAAWAGDDFRSPRRDWLLDARVDCDVALGEVLAVARATDRSGAPSDDGEYRFRFTDRAGIVVDGVSYGSEPLQAGDHHGVEYVLATPTICRLRGLHCGRLAPLLSWFPGYVLLPELLLAGLWASRVYRTFVVLRHGRATAAALIECTVPSRAGRRRRKYCRLRYRFQGTDGSAHTASQHEHVDSPLARIAVAADLGQPLAGAFVVHSETAPQQCRLVAAAEVAEAHA